MLSSLQNPLVKDVRKLAQRKGRRAQQLFIIEGTHQVEAACRVGYPLQTVCATVQWQAEHVELWQSLSHSKAEMVLVTPAVLQSMATTVNPDGVVATGVHRDSMLDHLDQSIPQTSRRPSLGLAVETLQDPGNLGTLIRTAAAAAADGLWISQDSVDLEHPKVLRASAGQWFQLPMQVCPNLVEQGYQWQQAGIQLVATTLAASLSYWQLDLRSPTVILLGNEGAGLSPELTTLATHRVKIPMAAAVESLNVSIAAALILYEAQRQRGFQAAEISATLR
ncbi:MAG: RNA methyltransferase [Cyanobacteria bacterium J06635_15]